MDFFLTKAFRTRIVACSTFASEARSFSRTLSSSSTEPCNSSTLISLMVFCIVSAVGYSFLVYSLVYIHL